MIADSSAIISFFLKEPGWKGLVKYLQFVTTLELSKKEAYNAVWKALKLTKRLRESEALKVLSLIDEYFDCCVVLEDQGRYLRTAFEIAKNNSITVYDSLFVALALDKGEPLVTLDAKQRKVAEGLGITVLP